MMFDRNAISDGLDEIAVRALGNTSMFLGSLNAFALPPAVFHC